MTPDTPINKIEASRTDWQKAIDRFSLLRRTTSTIPTNYLRLTDSQNGLLFQMDIEPKKIVGQPVLVIANSSGNVFSSYPYRGTVLSARKSQGEYLVKVLFYPSRYEEWSGERIEELKLFQIEQVLSQFLPTSEQLKNLKLNSILSVVNQARKQSFIGLSSKIREYEQYILNYKRDMESYTTKVTQLKTQLKSATLPDVTLQALLTLFDQFKKHKKIAHAYINTQCQMIIETTMLYATDRTTGKEDGKKPLGRFILLLDTRGKNYCQVANLDYCSHSVASSSHYPHPNVSGNSICMGDNGPLMDRMIQVGDFYEMADFLILFLSLFPQDSGSPHMNSGTWLERQIKEPKTNPWATDNTLWELSPHTKQKDPKPRKLTKQQQAEQLLKQHILMSPTPLGTAPTLTNAGEISF